MKKILRKKLIRISTFLLAIVIFGLSFRNTTISVFASDGGHSFDGETGIVDKGGSLYGTGSADDLDIVKLLDMALNRGGMSMSPATIKQFLEFWWNAVKSDLSDCIGNVDTSITGTQAFVDALNAALVSSEHYNNLGNIIKKYLGFCLTMEYKSLDDFKQLLTQEGTFREFLLSYVLDENGNIINTVKPFKGDGKTNASLSSDLVNMVRQASDYYIAEHESYFLIKSHTVNDISVSSFFYQQEYTSICNVLGSIPSDMQVMLTYQSLGGTQSAYRFTDFTNCGFVSASPTSTNPAVRLNTYIYNSNWTLTSSVRYCDIVKQADKTANDFTAVNIANSNTTHSLYQFTFNKPSNYPWLYTSDGRLIKIWKSLDAYKKYTVNKQDIYYTDKYSDFDTTADNTINFNYSYYATTNYSHTAIQNNIDNSTEVNETIINNIVNNYVTNNYYSDSSVGGGSGGDNPGGSNWFLELIKGIPDLLIALIDGLTGIISSAGDLLEKLISLFTDLFVPSGDFGEQIIDSVNQKFTFKNQSEENIMLIFDELPNLGQKAPSITLPFSKTTLSKYGLDDVTMSFDWYIPYKPTVDAIFSAILWAMFAFNQYFAIKNIINASGSAVDIATRL